MDAQSAQAKYFWYHLYVIKVSLIRAYFRRVTMVFHVRVTIQSDGAGSKCTAHENLRVGLKQQDFLWNIQLKTLTSFWAAMGCQGGKIMVD